jgi:intein-encoded DNA endonuclease-like protein
VGKYVVEVRSQTLYELLRKPVDLDRLKKYIEHCEKCVAAFIRGFADSEGCANKRGYIFILNTTRDYSPISWIFLGDLTLNQGGQEFMSGEEP